MIFFRDKKWNQTLRQIGERLGCALIVVSFLLESIHPVFAASPLRRTDLRNDSRTYSRNDPQRRASGRSVISVQDEDLDEEFDFDSELSFASTTPPQREFARTQASTEILPLIVERYRRQLEQRRIKAQADRAKAEELKRLNELIASAQYYERTLREKKSEVDRFQAYADYCGNQYRGAQGREDELAQAARKLHGVLSSTPQKPSKAKQEELPLSPQAAESYAELAKAYAKKAKRDHPNISRYAEAFSNKAQFYAAVLRDRSISGDPDRLRIIQNQLVRAHEELLAQWKIQVPQKRKQDGPKGPRKADGLVKGDSDDDSALGSRSGQSRGRSGGVDAKGAQARDEKLKKQLATSGEQIRKLRVSHRELGERLRVSNDLLRFNQGKERDLSQRLDEKAALVEVLRAQAQDLAQERDRISRERDAAVGGAAEKEKRLTALTSEIDSLQAQVRSEAAAKGQFERQYQDVKAELEKAIQRNDRLEGEYAVETAILKAALDNAQREVQRLSRDNKAFGQERDQLRDANRDLTERARRELVQRDAALAAHKATIDAGSRELQITQETLRVSEAGKTELGRQLNEAREQLRVATDGLEVSRRRVSELEATEQAVMKEARGLEERLIGSNQRLFNVTASRRLTEDQRDEAIRRLKALDSEATRIRTDRAQLIKRNSALEKLTAQQSATLEKLAAELATQTARGARVEELERAQANSLARIQALHGEMTGILPELQQLEAISEELKRRAEAAEARAADLTAQLGGTTETLEEEKRRVAQLTKGNEALLAQAEAVEAARKVLAAEKLSLEQAQGELKRSRAVKNVKIFALNASLIAKTKALEESQARFRALTAEKERMSSQNADRVQGLEAQIREVQARADRLNREKSQTAGDLQAEQRKFQDLETKSKELEARNREVLLQSKQRAEEVKGLQAQLSAAILNNSRLIAMSNSQASHISGLDAKLSAANRELADTAAKLNSSEEQTKRDAQAAAQRERELSAKHRTLVEQMAAATKLIEAKDELLTQAGRVQEELEKKQKILQIKLLLLRKSSGRDSARKTKEIEEVRAALEASRSAVEEGKSRFEALQSELADARRATAEVEARLAGEIETSAQTTAEQQRLLEEEKARLAALTTKIRDELDPELTRLRAGNEQLTGDLAVQEQKHAREIERLSAAHSAVLAAKDKELSVATADIQRLTKEVQAQALISTRKASEAAEAERQKLTLEARVAEMERKLEARQAMVIRLAARSSRDREELAESKHRTTALSARLEEVTRSNLAEAEKLRGELAAEQKRFKELDRAKTEGDQFISESRLAIEKLRVEKKKAEAAHEKSKRMVFEKEGELQGVRQELMQAGAKIKELEGRVVRQQVANSRDLESLRQAKSELEGARSKLREAQDRFDASESSRRREAESAIKVQRDLNEQNVELGRRLAASQRTIDERDASLREQERVQLLVKQQKDELELKLKALELASGVKSEEHNREVARLKAEIAGLEQTIAQRDRGIESLQSQLRAAEALTAGVQRDLVEAKQTSSREIAIKLEQIAELEKKIREELTPEIEKLTSENAELQKQLKEQSAAHEDVIRRLSASHEQKLSAERESSQRALTEARELAEQERIKYEADLKAQKKSHASKQLALAVKAYLSKKSLMKLKEEIKSVRAHLASSEGSRASSEGKILRLIAREKELTGKLEAEEKEKKAAQQDVERLNANQARLDGELRRLQAEREGHEKLMADRKPLAELLAEHDAQKSSLTRATLELESAKAGLVEAVSVKDRFHAEGERLKLEASELRRQIADLESAGEVDRSAASADSQLSQQKIKDLERELNLNSSRQAELSKDLTSHSQTIERQREQIDSLSREKARLAQENLEEKEKVTAQAALLESKAKELDAARKSGAEASEAQARIQREFDAAKLEFESARAAAQKKESESEAQLEKISRAAAEAANAAALSTATLERKNHSLQTELTAAQERAESAQAQITVNEAHIAQLRKTGKERETEVSRLADENIRLDRAKVAAEVQVRELNAAVNAAELARDAALQAQSRAEAEKAAAASRHAERLQEQALTLQGLRSDIDAFSRAADEHRRTEADAVAQLQSIRSAHAELERELERLRKSRAEEDLDQVKKMEAARLRAESVILDLESQLRQEKLASKKSEEEIAQLKSRLGAHETEFKRQKDELEGQLAELQAENTALRARVDVEVGAKEQALMKVGVLGLQRLVRDKKHQEEMAALRAQHRDQFDEMRRLLEEARAENARLKAAEGARSVSAAAVVAGVDVSAEIKGLMESTLDALSGVLTPQEIGAFKKKYADGNDLRAFKDEILEPVCRLSATKADRASVIGTQIRGKTDQQQLEYLRDTCIPNFISKYVGAGSKYGGAAGSVTLEQVKAKRIERLKKKLKEGLDPSRYGSIDSFVDDHYRTLACAERGSQPFIQIERLNVMMSQIKAMTQYKLAMTESLDRIRSNFIYYPYKRLNRGNDCTLIDGMRESLTPDEHGENLNLLMDDRVVKEINQLRTECASKPQGVHQSEASVSIGTDHSPKEVKFIFYCGNGSGNEFAYMVPTFINGSHYYVGTGGTLKDHYWGIRVDGNTDRDPFIYRHIRPEGNLCREDGLRDEVKFDKTQEEQANEDKIEKRAYSVTGMEIKRQGTKLEDKGGKSHKYEMVQYLGVDLSSYKGVIDAQSKKECRDQLLAQVTALHRNLILSRDIKPQNILFKAGAGSPRVPATCTLIDFGAGLMMNPDDASTPFVDAGLNFTDQYNPIDLANGDKSQERGEIAQRNYEALREVERTLNGKDFQREMRGVRSFKALKDKLSRKISDPRFFTPQIDLYQTGYMLGYLSIPMDIRTTFDNLLKELKTVSAESAFNQKLNEINTLLMNQKVPDDDRNKIMTLLSLVDQKYLNGQTFSTIDRSEMVKMANYCISFDPSYCSYWNPQKMYDARMRYLTTNAGKLTVNWDLIGTPEQKIEKINKGAELASRSAAQLSDLKEKINTLIYMDIKNKRQPHDASGGVQYFNHTQLNNIRKGIEGHLTKSTIDSKNPLFPKIQILLKNSNDVAQVVQQQDEEDLMKRINKLIEDAKKQSSGYQAELKEKEEKIRLLPAE